MTPAFRQFDDRLDDLLRRLDKLDRRLAETPGGEVYCLGDTVGTLAPPLRLINRNMGED